MTILFVENHARFAKLAVATFLSAHDVTISTNIIETRKLLMQKVFDVVLVDYDLDDGKGTELIVWIREKSVACPVIAISAHKMGNAALTEAGADAVCAKTNFKNLEKIIDLCVIRKSSPK